jgi:hypothetical protein
LDEENGGLVLEGSSKKIACRYIPEFVIKNIPPSGKSDSQANSKGDASAPPWFVGCE